MAYGLKLDPQYEEIGIVRLREIAGRQKYWGWVEAEGYLMYQGGNDDMIALRFQSGHTYEPQTRALWRKLCSRAEIAVDVGTHSGVFTLDAHLAGAKLVLSVEPHPINYARLVMNMRRNNFTCDGVFLGAAGDEDAVRMMMVKEIYRVHAAGQVGVDSDDGIHIPVRVARLDSLVNAEMHAKVSVLKIDAENLTPAVLDGMPKILEHRPDLIVECTEGGLTEKLRPLGYKFWRIWENREIEGVDDLAPHNPGDNYNGTDENCRNRFASCKGLP
jgi:FkbM family methyltransferase